MKKYYKFAGVEIEIDIPEDRMYEDARDLAPFEVESVQDPHRFTFKMVTELTPPNGACLATPPGYRVYAEAGGSARYIGSVQESWQNAYMRSKHRGKEHHVQLKTTQYADRIGTHTVLGALAAEHLVARAGGVIFHSAYIEWQGKAVLFTAPSGTGKSTQAELWRSLRGANIINGDRSAVRMDDGRPVAAGVPFSGSSQICLNQILPLAAIVYLGQAAQTSIRRLRGYEAFFKVWEGCSVNTWDREDVRLVSDVVQQVVSRVPVFHLMCTPDEAAVIALERALREVDHG